MFGGQQQLGQHNAVASSFASQTQQFPSYPPPGMPPQQGGLQSMQNSSSYQSALLQAHSTLSMPGMGSSGMVSQHQHQQTSMMTASRAGMPNLQGSVGMAQAAQMGVGARPPVMQQLITTATESGNLRFNPSVQGFGVHR